MGTDEECGERLPFRLAKRGITSGALQSTGQSLHPTEVFWVSTPASYYEYGKESPSRLNKVQAREQGDESRMTFCQCVVLMVLIAVHSHAEVQVEFSCEAVRIVFVVFAAEIPHGAHVVGEFGGLHTQSSSSVLQVNTTTPSLP